MHISGPPGLKPVKLVFTYKENARQVPENQKTATLYFSAEAGKILLTHSSQYA